MNARVWARRSGITLGVVVLLAALGLAAAVALGWTAGTRPAALGFKGGTFPAGDWKPNWVSSTVAKDDAHYVAPLTFTGDPVVAWARLQAVAAIQPGAGVATKAPGYLHVEYRSALLGFVDDAQFAMDAGRSVIHVKSGARLGIRDFGVNRQRVEAVRAAFTR